MNAYLLHADGALLPSGRRLLKAADAMVLTETMALLEAARSQAEARAQAAEREGFAAGEAAGRAEFAKAIATLAAAETEYQATREAEVARLALAALRHIAGAIADAEMTLALARRAAASLVGRGPIEITVAPDMVPHVGASLATTAVGGEITVSGDPMLKATQCRIATPDGHVVADLETQLAAIEQRWSDVHGD